MATMYDVQIQVEDEIITRNGIVTISGPNAVAYTPVDGKHVQTHKLKVRRTKDYGQKVFLWGHTAQDPDTEVFWSVNLNPRKPCNCGGKQK